MDRVIETGVPVEIERKSHKLKIVLEEKKSKLNNLAITRKSQQNWEENILQCDRLNVNSILPFGS